MTDRATSLVVVVTTVDDEAVADRIAEAAVHERLAACVQVEAIQSTYRWHGAIERAREWRLLFKTTTDRHDALTSWLRERHPYDLPAIYALAVTAATDRFARWVRDETAPPG